MTAYATATFQNTHTAMQAQRLLSQTLTVTTMPTLRALTAGCGISLRFHLSDTPQVVRLLEDSGLSGWSVYEVGTELTKIAEKTQDKSSR